MTDSNEARICDILHRLNKLEARLEQAARELNAGKRRYAEMNIDKLFRDLFPEADQRKELAAMLRRGKMTREEEAGIHKGINAALRVLAYNRLCIYIPAPLLRELIENEAGINKPRLKE